MGGITKSVLKDVFQINLDSAPLPIVWDAFNTTLRGQAIAHLAMIVKNKKNLVSLLQENVELAISTLSSLSSARKEADLAKQNLKTAMQVKNC